MPHVDSCACLVRESGSQAVERRHARKALVLSELAVDERLECIKGAPARVAARHQVSLGRQSYQIWNAEDDELLEYNRMQTAVPNIIQGESQGKTIIKLQQSTGVKWNCPQHLREE